MPELTLGIIPGFGGNQHLHAHVFGNLDRSKTFYVLVSLAEMLTNIVGLLGTQRLPRLVGTSKAVEMMLV
jgi:enoyl-CoA hydratase/carnithine racemase